MMPATAKPFTQPGMAGSSDLLIADLPHPGGPTVVRAANQDACGTEFSTNRVGVLPGAQALRDLPGRVFAESVRGDRGGQCVLDVGQSDVGQRGVVLLAGGSGVERAPLIVGEATGETTGEMQGLVSHTRDSIETLCFVQYSVSR